MKISYLAEHPEFIETLASWLLEHWRFVLKDDTLETRVAKLQNHLSRDRLPIALVAHEGRKVFGTAALRIHDLPDRKNLSPWLGGVFVGQSFRNRGIGAALSAAVEKLANEKFGFSTLYLFTLDKQDWYRKQGWSRVDGCSWLGNQGDIMSKWVNVKHVE